MERKIIYYDDEINDDFAGTGIKGCEVDGRYKYQHKSLLWRVLSGFLYYVIAIPIVFIIERVIFGVRFVNARALRECSEPVFLYGNHTGWYDAFTPCLLSFPRRNYTMVSSDAVSIFGLRWAVEMLGGVPVPTEMSGMRSFTDTVAERHKGANITIYPETHIWPYFTGVRDFPDASFTYPARLGGPVFAFFTAYTKPRGFFSFFRRADVTVYVSDPIYADEGLTPREARKNIRDKVYSFMKEMSEKSDYAVYEYRRREE